MKHVPNALTIGRILVTPLALWGLATGTFWGQFTGASLFILAAISDYWDGKLARQYGVGSRIGQFLDPLADKVLVLGAFMLVSWLASRVSLTSKSKPAQYAALGGFVLAEALIFVPMLYLADNYAPGAIQSAAVVTLLGFGGLTTVAEQGFPQVNPWAELALLALEMHDRDTPYRFALVPNAMFFYRREGDAAAAERAAANLLGWSSDRIRILRHAKYYADGAIFSQLMRMSEPYLDGHHGEWMMTPEEQWAVLSTFWAEDWDLHIHVNGDAGLDLVLDQIERLRDGDPRPGRRIVLEHYGYAREDQHRRVRELGIAVSNNAYYVHELAPIYAESGLGPGRAADISPLGALARAGVPISFHSDFPMAPAEPLTLMWAAVNRIGSDGRVWGPDQRLALDLALRAVTIEAAWSLGLEDEIGSLRPGKRADFTVLGADPHEVEPQAIRDIEIWGTVLDGRAYPLRSEGRPR